MKKVSLLLIMVFMTMIGFAQQKGWEKKSNEEKASMYAERVSSKLSLNADQKEKIKMVQLKHMEAMDEWKKDHKDLAGEDVEDMADENADLREEHMKMMEDYKDDMKDILTDAQYQKWEMMHDEQMKMHNKGMKMHKKQGDWKKDKSHSDHHDDDYETDDGSLK